MKFRDIEQGEIFMPLDEDGAIYMKVFGHNLQNIVNEGQGGHGVLLSEGLLCFFNEDEEVELIMDDMFDEEA